MSTMEAALPASQELANVKSSGNIDKQVKLYDRRDETRNGKATTQQSTPTTTSPVAKVERTLWTGRTLFVACLLSTAVIIGLVAHHFLSESEQDLARVHWEGIADRALTAAMDRLAQKRWDTVTLASMAAETLPDATAWPKVFVPGFERLAHDFARGGSTVFNFAPLVLPQELDEWETFAYQYLHVDRKPIPFDTDVGVSTAGKGVWAYNRTKGKLEQYLDKGGLENMSWNSTHNVMFPVLSSSYREYGPSGSLMFNLHSVEVRGSAIDRMLDCVVAGQLDQQKGAVSLHNLQDQIDLSCTAMSSKIGKKIRESKDGPSYSFYQPIRAVSDLSQVKGLISSTSLWKEILQAGFTDSVDGVDIVLLDRRFQESNTFYVENGKLEHIGWGDHHHDELEGWSRSSTLTLEDLSATTPCEYILTFYPSAQFRDSYSTRNPRRATIGSVCIILFTSLAFLLYDFFVRRELLAKKDLLEAKRQFMRFVCHEVRSPLNSVVMGLDVAESELGSTTKGCREEADGCRENFLDLIHDIKLSAQNAVNVLDDMLNYDKIQAQKLTLETEQVGVQSLLSYMTEEYHLPATNKGISLDLRMCLGNYHGEDAEQGSVFHVDDAFNFCFLGDAARLKQVMRNFLSNAVKFTPENGRILVLAEFFQSDETEIDLSASLESSCSERLQCGTCRIGVVDSGAGMTEDQVEKLFRDGTQFNVNALQNGKGSGLGLFIAKELVELHGGSIHAKSEGLGKGSTFQFVLPLYRCSHADSKEGSTPFRMEKIASGAHLDIQKTVAAVSRPPSADVSPEPFPDNHSSPTSALSPDDTKVRVLIVEDVASNRKLLRRLLERKGYSCSEAENGEMGVRLWTESPNDFDVILMDYEMPVKTGPSAARDLRQAGCTTCIVGVTGNMLPEDVDFFIRSGADGVLAKPIRMPALESMLREHGVLPDSSPV